MLPLFRNNTDAATLQIYIMLVMIPWTIKPIIGLCSDYISLFGYGKRAWLLLSWFFGVCSSVLLLIQNVSNYTNHYLVVICFIGINFEIALYDLLSEGKYAEIRRDNKHLGSDLTTFTQALQMSGLLAGTSFVGFLSDAQLYGVLYILTLIFCVLPVGPTVLGWLPESPTEVLSRERFNEEWPIILVVAICGAGGVTVSILTTVIPSPAGPFVGLGVALIFLTVILYGSNIAFKEHPLITAVALYQVVTSLSSPTIGSQLDYFYTASAECLPDGPHFSYAYYTSYTGIVGTLVGLLGTVIYHVFLSRLRFRPVLLITTFLVCLAGLSDLMIVLRWNIRMGIPDIWAYMIGEAVLEPLLGALNWLPVSALIALSAPPGMEASCFAFLAGLSNFARMVSELSGSIIIHFTSNGACDFSSLWWLVLTCHVSFRLIIGVLATWLIPDIGQQEEV